jgi:PadR family transcriptional regulator PadR
VLSRPPIEALRGSLDLLVLKTLSLSPTHGWGISQRVQQISGGEFEVNQGSLYPALHRLERDGLVTSSWSEVAGRKRRVYKLSRKGRAALDEQERDWRRFERAVNLVLADR